MPFLTQCKTNRKFILIVFVLALIIAGGILFYQSQWLSNKEVDTSNNTANNVTNCANKGERVRNDGQGFPKVCCSNLNPMYGSDREDCNLPDVPGDIGICSNCGNSICEPQNNENKCNCSQDCLKGETADWNIYRNEEYGFSIDYPKNWYLSDAPELQRLDYTGCVLYKEKVESRGEWTLEPCEELLLSAESSTRSYSILIYLSNWANGYCSRHGCIDVNFKKLVDSPDEKDNINNFDFSSVAIIKMGKEGYEAATKYKGTKLEDYSSVNKNGVKIHLFTSKSPPGCNHKTAYWSYNDSYFMTDMYPSLDAGCIMTNQEIGIFSQIISSLKFY